eukprot:CAMPEP_0197056132 /NCGR_PEP_ID=MMETSP1384-20130603/79490_1 /TAXON_ID=29189 /ORGANISM="Ammonia sp." /LENGTH=233 /DNA_ID=CAMNT_0042489997 /DNA_START=56 /DNA_END=754 /DNA_ORIENTATION=+
MSSSEYGRYAGQVGSEQTRYDNKLNSFQSSLNKLKSTTQQLEADYTRNTQRMESERQRRTADRHAYWAREMKTKQEQWQQKITAVEQEMQQEIQRVRDEQQKAKQEKIAKLKQQQQARRHTVSPNQYLPSLSTGIYGSYSLRKFPRVSAHHSHDHATQVHGDDDEKMEHEAQTDDSQSDLMYQQIYAANKRVDEKYKLEFKAECNVKGCCNQPQVDAKLLKGDMYICKVHRME